MTEKQKRHHDRKWLKMLKRELLGWKRARALGMNIYGDPNRLPA